MAFVVVVLFYFIFFLHLLQTTDSLRRVPHSRQRVGIWRMTKPLTSSSVADALAQCYKNAGHWGSQREILSIAKGRTIGKVMGGRWRIFEPREFFFLIKLLHEFQF